MRPYGWTLTQDDWCPHEKGRLGYKKQGKGDVKTQGEGDHLSQGDRF